MIKLTREIVDRRLVVNIVAAITQMTDTDSERTSADVPSVETVDAERNTKNFTSAPFTTGIPAPTENASQ